MNQQLFSVSKSGKLTRVSMQFEWLSRMGFVNNSLVAAIPDTDGNGIRFTVCNENITSYSDLLCKTEKQGGKFVTVCQSQKDTHVYSCIHLILGQKVNVERWAAGTPLVAIYEYGTIHVRKLPNKKYYTVKRAYDNRHDINKTLLILQNSLLSDAGFLPHSLATAAAEHGSITITLWNGGLENYSELVKHVRKNGLKLVQIGEKNNTPYIGITGGFVTGADFNIGDIFSVDYSYGSLQLQKLYWS